MVYCGELKSNGVLYHTFYDRNTKALRFYLNGEEVENDYLFNTYNHPKNCLRGYGRLTTMILSLGIIASAFVATAIQNDVISYEDIKEPFSNEITVDDEKYVFLSGEELYEEMLSKNPDLTEYLEMSRDVIVKYGEYMNQEELLSTIGNLELIPTHTRDEIASGLALAFYSKDENKIFYDDRINMDHLLKTCLYHEFLHYYSQSGLYDYDIYSSGYIGYAVNEGMTEMLNCELNDEEMFTYHKEAAYVGAICEIVGPEVLEEAYFSNDVDYLIDKLAEYSSEDDALALIKNIDIAKDSYESFVFYDNDDDYDNFFSANNYAWDILADMYEYKYGRDINEDSLMMAYKSATTLKNYSDFDFTEFGDGFLVDVVVNKHYFVKPDNDVIIVDFSYRDETGLRPSSVNINESDRLITNGSVRKK